MWISVLFTKITFKFPFVLSAFFGIKEMCTLPVEQLQTSGIFWFKDLTLADPTFVLPLLATASILAIIHVKFKLKIIKIN